MRSVPDKSAILDSDRRERIRGEVEAGGPDTADYHVDGAAGGCFEDLLHGCWVADVTVDDGEVPGLKLGADAFGCEGGGEFGGGAGEGGAGVVVFEGEGEAVACAVAGCAEEGEGFGRGHFWWWWRFVESVFW